MKKIFLYGPPGSGKTVVGKRLAKNLNAAFIDIDMLFEQETGSSIAEYITNLGETAFRDVEQRLIEGVCRYASPEPGRDRLVVALGGGALLRETNRNICQQAGNVVFLDTEIATLFSRLKRQEGQRPLLLGDLESKLTVLLQNRKDHYNSFKLRVATNYLETAPKNYKTSSKVKSPSQIAWEIQQKLGCYFVDGMGPGYQVSVESGSLTAVGRIINELGLPGPVMVVCDENIDSLYSDIVLQSIREHGYTANKVVVAPGESNKSIETVLKMWRSFLQHGLDRRSLVVALGGGVVCDMAGFAASTYMRGCPWIAVPTTLLSMVDASIGGKTGFDLPEGKNLVGSFYPPRLVLVDPEVLTTLPENELRSGMAEVIKHGIIADPELYDLCSKGYETIKANLEIVVRRAIGVKVITIVKDPYEHGIRAALNLGHTVGHGVEIASNFKLKHGEAISIGMVVEARLSQRLELLEDDNFVENLISALSKIGLPTEIPSELSSSKIIQAMRFDKKKDGNVIKFALPVKVGSVKVGVPVTDMESVL